MQANQHGKKYLQKQSGFTLVELVIVIVILGIVSAISFSFVTFGARFFVDVSERQIVLDDSRFLIERLSREIRMAVPYSQRVLTNSAQNYSCLEFTPIVASGLYNSITLSPATSAQMDLINVSGNDFVSGQKVSVFSTNSNQVYTIDTNGAQTFLIDSVDALASNSQVIRFANAVGFGQPSNANRYYIWQTPVSYCVESGSVRRYANYNPTANQLTPTQLKAAVNVEHSLMAENVTNSIANEVPFMVSSSVDLGLVRHAQVAIYFEFSRLSDSNEDMFFHHLVQVPNAP